MAVKHDFLLWQCAGRRVNRGVGKAAAKSKRET
jgi:hypothetical protein